MLDVSRDKVGVEERRGREGARRIKRSGGERRKRERK
jgi:hypothetical protein